MFFELPDLIAVGRIIIPLPLVAFAVLGLFVNFYIKWLCRRLGYSHLIWLEAFLNALFAYIIIWKFSILLLQPLAIIQQPSLLLFAHGGRVGQALGGLSALIVIWFTLKNTVQSWKLFADISAHWLLITLTIYWLLFRSYGLPTTWPWGMPIGDSQYAYHPLHAYHFILGLVIIFFLALKKIRFGQGNYAANVLFFLGLSLLVISNFSYHAYTYWGLASQQWFFLFLIVLGLLPRFFLSKINKE